VTLSVTLSPSVAWLCGGMRAETVWWTPFSAAMSSFTRQYETAVQSAGRISQHCSSTWTRGPFVLLPCDTLHELKMYAAAAAVLLMVACPFRSWSVLFQNGWTEWSNIWPQNQPSSHIYAAQCVAALVSNAVSAGTEALNLRLNCQ